MVSGYVSSKVDSVKGLFQGLDRKCLVFTELGQTLSLNGNDLKVLMGTFASAFDGVMRNQVGTQDYKGDLKAHFAMLACGTPATLAQHRSIMEPIGTRFLYFRLPDMSRVDIKKRQQARKTITGRVQKEKTIRALVAEHLSHLPPVPDELAAWPDEIDEMAEFLSLARAAVRTDMQGDVYAVDPEDPDRATHQLNCLGLALARLYGKSAIGKRELGILWQITLSSVSMERLLILKTLSREPLSVEGVVEMTGLSRSMVYRTIKPLCFAELVIKDVDTSKYRLSTYADTIASQMSHGGSIRCSTKDVNTSSSSSSSSSAFPSFVKLEDMPIDEWDLEDITA